LIGIILSKHLTEEEELDLTNIEGSPTQAKYSKTGTSSNRRILIDRLGDGEITLGLYKRLILSLAGQVYVEHRTMPGWSRSLPFYAFKCPDHGTVVDYPHGHDQRLDYPKCHRERDFMRILAG